MGVLEVKLPKAISAMGMDEFEKQQFRSYSASMVYKPLKWFEKLDSEDSKSIFWGFFRSTLVFFSPLGYIAYLAHKRNLPIQHPRIAKVGVASFLMSNYMASILFTDDLGLIALKHWQLEKDSILSETHKQLKVQRERQRSQNTIFDFKEPEKENGDSEVLSPEDQK